MIYVCFSLKSVFAGLELNDVLEKNYQNVYKPVIKFLYSHPDFSFTFSFSGNQIQFLKKKRTEFITILKQLVDRNQVEVLGGGYYDPVLPLLYTVDRNGQLDLLSSEVRQAIGKRPRGVSVFADCWDSSLVNSLQTCGFEFVLLESSLVPQTKRKYLPLIMTDRGKSIEIIPYYDNLKPSSEIQPEEFVENIIHTVEKVSKKDLYPQLQTDKNPDRIVNIRLSNEDILSLIESSWLEKLDEYLRNNPDCKVTTSTTSNYRKNMQIKIPVYIPAGINGSISRWIARPYTEMEPRQKYPMTVYDFMETYPQCSSLNNRIMYISMLVNQYKNDKMRKNSAREKLWQAQNGVGLLCTMKGAFSNSKYRQQAYKKLMEAEKILREDGEFKEAVTSFDYNGDGLSEYVCRMQNYFSYITLISGAVQELEILKNTGNYADNLSRVMEYDNCEDDYERGLFVDHVFTSEQFESYFKGEPAGNGIFSKIQYSEVKFSRNRHEIMLTADAMLMPSKQKINLRKKYIINSTGMIVQYILKNESDKPLNLYFAVEANFAHTDFEPENVSYYNLETLTDMELCVFDDSKPICETENNSKFNAVDLVRISDVANKISFSFEPNEKCGYCFYPLVFKRPDFHSDERVPVSMTFVSTLYWNISLEPGMETEKNINFVISSVRKKKS